MPHFSRRLFVYYHVIIFQTAHTKNTQCRCVSNTQDVMTERIIGIIKFIALMCQDDKPNHQ